MIFQTPASIGFPTSFAKASPHAQEIRPGLVLHWNEGPAPICDRSAAAYLLCQLSPRAGVMTFLTDWAVPPASPDWDFHGVITLDRDPLSELLGDNPAPPPASTTRPLSPTARLALESIRRCPFVGSCRTMALTARCHDLLVEFLSARNASAAPVARPLSSSAERTRAAADILCEQLERPPSIAGLARQVGLSETTLKRSFVQIFGTTLYGYVRARRMQRARELLESGAATVLEAATLVGYSNPSNFAAAFRREFGLNPKEFQIAVRR